MAGTAEMDVRRGPLVPEDAIQPLLRPIATARDSTICAAAGLAGFGVAPLAGHSVLAWPSLAAGVLGVGASIRRGQRLHERNILSVGVIAGLIPLIGVRHLEKKTVTLGRWTRGRDSVPARIIVRYHPAISVTPQWMSEALRGINSATGRTYGPQTHRPRRRVLIFALDESTSEEAVVSPARRRLDQAVVDLMGPTAKTSGVRFDDDGHPVSFEVAHNAGAKLAADGYRRRVEKVLNTMLPGRWRAAWDLEGDRVSFERRPTMPTQVWVPVTPQADPQTLRSNYRAVRVPYALDEDGIEIAWRPAVVPHFLLTGQTGAGKTSTARALISALTCNGWAVWIADVKRIEFRDFRGWPNVQVVASTMPQIVAMIHQAAELMKHRYDLIENGRAVASDFEPVFVLVDEYTECVNVLRGWYAGIKVRGGSSVPPTLEEIASLLRLGRSARVHLLFTAQRPDVSLFGSGEMRDNLGQRASLGRLSPNGALMMWENAGIGVSIPRGFVGRATTTNDDGVPVEAQAYRFPDFDAEPGSEEADLLDRLRPSITSQPRLLILDPQVSPEDESLTWFDYANAHWVRATERPDLDPLVRVEDDDVDGTSAGSALSLLGLMDSAGAGARRTAGSVIRLPERDTTATPEPDGDPSSWAQVTPLRAGLGEQVSDGYGPEVISYASQLNPGDLFHLDDRDMWVVIDEPPEPDPIADHHYVISWRSDDDDAGVVSWEESTPLSVRLPADEMEGIE